MGPCVLTRGHLNQHGSGSLEACGEHCCKHIDHHAPPSSLVLGPGSRCPGFFVDVGCPGCLCVCVPRCSQERASSRLVLRRHLVLYHCHGLHFRPFLPFLTIFQWPIPRLTHLPLDTRGSCPCTQPTTGRLNRQVLARAVCMSSLEKRSPNLHKARGSRLKAPSPSAQLHCASVGVFDLAEASLGLLSDSFSLSSVSCVDYPSTHSYSTPTNHFSPSLPRANRHRPQTGG